MFYFVKDERYIFFCGGRTACHVAGGIGCSCDCELLPRKEENNSPVGSIGIKKSHLFRAEKIISFVSLSKNEYDKQKKLFSSLISVVALIGIRINWIAVHTYVL